MNVMARPAPHVPFSALLGFHAEHAADGESRLVMELRPELMNYLDCAHGGVVMALLDAAMAHAARSRVPQSREVMTVDMHISFMRPAQGRLVARGRTTGGGRSLCFCEATIEDGRGEAVARAMSTFRYREPA